MPAAPAAEKGRGRRRTLAGIRPPPVGAHDSGPTRKHEPFLVQKRTFWTKRGIDRNEASGENGCGLSAATIRRWGVRSLRGDDICLRSIVRQLPAGVPVRVVAVTTTPSVVLIERSFSPAGGGASICYSAIDARSREAGWSKRRYSRGARRVRFPRRPSDPVFRRRPGEHRAPWAASLVFSYRRMRFRYSSSSASL